jgi:hypothetical protein
MVYPCGYTVFKKLANSARVLNFRMVLFICIKIIVGMCCSYTTAKKGEAISVSL